MAIGAILGVAQAGMGIASAFGSFNDQAAQAKAQNQALKRQFKEQLQIWDKTERDKDQLYSQRLGSFDLGTKAVEKAASAAYGAIDFNRSERTKQASSQLINQYLGMAKSGGAAAAAGKTGNNAAALDAGSESNFVRNQQNVLRSLFGGDAADMMSRTKISNQTESQQNQLFGQVAAGYTRSKAPLEPTQVSGPSTTDLAIGVGSSLLKGANTFSSMMAPDPGEFGFGNSLSDYGLNTQSVFTSTTNPYELSIYPTRL